MQNPSLLLDCTAFHPDYHSGGVSIYMQEILPALEPHFRFAAFFKHIEPAILESCGPVIGSSQSFKGNMLVWRDQAVRKLVKTGAQGVWFPTQFSAWFPALPSLVTIHDMAAFLTWRSFSPLAKVYMPSTLLASSLHARRLVVVSEASANDLNRLFPWTKSKTVVARHGLPSDVRRRAMEVGISRHRTDGPLSMLFLDGANPRKRLDLSLMALDQMGWANRELAITGNPEAVKQRVLSVLGRVPDQVSFVGRLPRADLLDTLAAADLLLYPSDFEGFGFPLIEAMAFGTSVVSFPGNAEKEVGAAMTIYAKTLDADGLHEAIKIAEERCRDGVWQHSIMRHALSFQWEESIAIHHHELGNLIA